MRLQDYAPRPAHLKWLLDSDPAIRWQVMRDLTGEAPGAMAAERSRVATEGWGAQLLAIQSSTGNWGGPKEDLVALYSLVVLKDLGLDPDSKEALKMIGRVNKRLVFKQFDNRPFLQGETEPCINGRILAIGSYFKEPNDALANQPLGEQREDGGWNCEAWPFLSPKRPPSRRSSFHTTICVLEGLLEYERAGRKSAAVSRARKRAENYLLDRRMFRSLRTGEVIDKRWLRFSYPTFWHFDVLRGLDYMRNAGIKPDSRVNEAIETVIERRHQNGAAQPPSSRTYSIEDGDRGRQGKPMEYTALSPSPALVRQLNVPVVTWDAEIHYQPLSTITNQKRSFGLPPPMRFRCRLLERVDGRLSICGSTLDRRAV